MRILSLLPRRAGWLCCVAFLSIPGMAASKVELAEMGLQLPAIVRNRTSPVLGKMHDFYAGLFPSWPASPVRFDVRLIQGRNAFHAYQNQVLGRQLGRNAFYSDRLGEIVIRKRTPASKMVSDLLHEASHGILRKAWSRPPKWFNEGLAELWENAEVQNGEVVFRPHVKKIRRLSGWEKEGALLPLRDYLRLSSEAWLTLDKSGNEKARAIAWSLVDLILDQPGGRETLRRIASGIKDQGLSSVAALDQAYPGGLDTLQSQWLARVRQSAG